MKTMRVLRPVFVVALCFLCRGIEAHGAADNFPANNDGVHYIYTAEELAALSLDDTCKLYVLGADINIPPDWVFIGQEAPAAAFKGSLDGRGHSISGLNIKVTDGGAYGLFGKLEGASISNIILVDAGMRIGDIHGYKLAAGLLAGEAISSTVSNITIMGGDIFIAGEGLANAAIGGLIGNGEDLKLDGICVTVEIGMHNSLRQHDTPKAVGGMAGSLNNSVLEGSCANVQICISAEAVGGIVGFATDTNFRSTSTNSGAVKGKSATGGFSGRVEGTGTIIDCHSHADVTGGIAGGFAGQISGNQLPANANHGLKVTGSSATGKVTSSAGGIAGGFLGEGKYTLIQDSSAYGEVDGCAGAGGFVGRLSCLSRVIYTYAVGDVRLGGGIACLGANALPIATEPHDPAKFMKFAGGFVGELVNSACVEFSYSTGSVIAGRNDAALTCATHAGNTHAHEATILTAVGGFAGIISANGLPNTITHSLSFAPWVVGDGYVNRFVGHADHDGINGCYAHLGSMVVRSGNIAHVLPSAFGQDGADMSSMQVEDITKRLGWRREVSR